MSIAFYITIDTEEDSWSDRSREGNTVENIQSIPVLQEIFDEYRAIPTYLINYPVATSEDAVRILAPLHETGRCEIGTHCHPWNTPPFDEPMDDHSSMMCNLPAALVEQKMASLHHAIEERFGHQPVSFRAGRWGFGPTIARAIHGLGYRVDTSVTPLVSWKGHSGPDFTNAPLESYWLDLDDVTSPGNEGQLYEVPPTIGFLQRDAEASRRRRERILRSPLKRFHTLGILDKLRILNRRWLSPELSTAGELVTLARRFLASGASYLNMSFHSTTLLPGKSPFVKDRQELEEFLRRIEAVLRFAAARELEFAPLRRAVE